MTKKWEPPKEQVDKKYTPEQKAKAAVKKANRVSWHRSTGVQKRIDGPIETEEHIKAYNLYVGMGDERSLEKVAAELERPKATIYSWAKKFDWVNRVIAWEKENKETVTLENFNRQMELKKFQLEFVNKMILDAAEVDENGVITKAKVPLRSVGDLQTLYAMRERILYGDKSTKSSGQGGTNIEKAVFIIQK